MENQNFYNLSITAHGLIMIFFLVMPGLYGGFGNFLVPLFIGSSEVEFPRINNYSFYLLTIAALLIATVMSLEFPGS